MKSTLAIFALLALASLAATVSGPGRVRRFAPTSSTPEITPGYANLLVWWKITTNDANGGYVKDWSPSGLNYATQDVTASQFTVTNLAGVTCAYLDGGDYSSTTNTALLNNSTNLTLAAWINRSVEVGWAPPLAMRGSKTSTLGSDVNSTLGMVPTLNGTYANYPFITTGYQSAWMHLCVTYDGAKMLTYTNGIQADSKGLSGGLGIDDAWRLGYDDADAPRKWNGYLDDARIYNRVLTSNEVLAVAQEARQ